MSTITIPRLAALILALAACRPAHAGDPEAYKLYIPIFGTQPGRHDHTQEVLPARPGAAWIYQGKKVPIRNAGCVYIVERSGRDRLLIREDGLNPVGGWVDSHDFVPVKQAEAFFSEAIEADRNPPFPYLMRAVLRHHLGQLDLALSDLNETLRLDPRCADALEGRASNYALRGRRDEAFADINRAIEIRPTDASLYHSRSCIRGRFDGKQLEQALADINRAIELDPSSRSAIMERATLKFRMKRPQEAIKELKEAVSRFPDPCLLLMAAMLMFQENQRGAAREIVKERLDQNADRELAYKCHLLLSLFDESERNRYGARSEVDAAIALDPGKEDAYLSRAGLQSTYGFSLKVLEDLNLAIRANPSNPDSYEARAVAYYTRRDYRAALDDIGTCLRLKPDDPEIHERLALILATCPDERIRNGQEAVAQATLACDLSGWKTPESLDTLAAAEAAVGRFRAATAHEEKAISLLTDKDGREEEYRNSLSRYRDGKPSYRLSLLEEWGIRTPRHVPN